MNPSEIQLEAPAFADEGEEGAEDQPPHGHGLGGVVDRVGVIDLVEELAFLVEIDGGFGHGWVDGFGYGIWEPCRSGRRRRRETLGDPAGSATKIRGYRSICN